MAIESTSATAASATSEVANSRKTIADNFDTFLSILTTQLKNQNPLEPMDTNQFTQQLVQFTGVEQQLKTNEFLEALVLGNQSAEAAAINASNQAVNMIGKTVVAKSDSMRLEGGEAEWTYTASGDAPKTTVTIRDSSGQTVFSEELPLSAGQGTYKWDGKDESGLDYPDGTYSIEFAGRDANDNEVPVLTQVKGVVETVDLTGDVPVMIVNGSRVLLGSILSVTTASTEADT